MKIYDKRNPITVPFKDIQPGECFIDIEDELNIKIDVSYYEETEEYRPNAVALDDGQPWRCDDDTQVIKVRAMVTIE
jgi:hypothetical protein